jgi:putative Mg2+ transporter-C (MgtC) family protein
MEFLDTLFYSDEITWETSAVRLLISFVAGGLVGLERELHNQPAGLRTHILISIGSTLVMLISIYIPHTFQSSGDPGRIAAQVVSGIGFLGAGAILKFGADIKGLTTAASIWAMAAVGMSIGAGMFRVSAVAITVILFALTVMNMFEKNIFKQRSLRRIEIIVKKRNSSIRIIEEIFKTFDLIIISTGFERNVHDATDRFIFMVAVTPDLEIQKLADNLEQQPGMISVIVDIIR